MKLLQTILFTLLLVTVFGQNKESLALIDSVKTLLNSQANLTQDEYDKFDYYDVVSLLDRALALDPKNAESHYYLGYAYSRINSRDGRSMIDMNLDLVFKASEQFEEVIRLSPKYEGEIIALDPYSKLSSEWGSLAMSYWHNGDVDSSLWAFSEGKKRGGFGDFMLELNKKVLDTCSENAILISSGDNFTITLWYLQIVEGYRTDVAVIDVSLLNADWYPTYLQTQNVVQFTMPNEVLDTLQYTTWKDSTITIKGFSWVLKPSYFDLYILRGDRVFLSLLQANEFKRDVFFTIGFIESFRLSLGDFVENYIVAGKLVTCKISAPTYTQYKEAIVPCLKLSRFLTLNSTDEVRSFDNVRMDLFSEVVGLFNNNQIDEAKELMNLLDKYANGKKYPYFNESLKSYAENLRQRVR